MTLRAKITLYLIALHAVLAGAATFILIERPMLLFAVEGAFVVSVMISIRLVRALFVPLDLIQTGAELISERDFTSSFVPVGQPEMDTLIDVYNRMIERLREERLAAQEQGELLQKIVEASPAAIVICDFDGNVERRNPAADRLLGDEPLPSLAPGESRLIAYHGARRLKMSRAEFRDRGFAKSFYVIEEMTEELRLSEKAAYEKLIRMMSHEVNNSERVAAEIPGPLSAMASTPSRKAARISPSRPTASMALRKMFSTTCSSWLTSTSYVRRSSNENASRMFRCSSSGRSTAATRSTS